MENKEHSSRELSSRRAARLVSAKPNRGVITGRLEPHIIAAEPPDEHNHHLIEFSPEQKPTNRRPGDPQNSV